MRARRIARVVSRIYDDALRRHAITAAQMNLLVGIAKMEPVAPAQLGRFFDLEKSTLSRNLTRMRQAGWISSKKSGRGFELRLSAGGRKKLDAIYPDWRGAQKNVEELLGKTAVEGLVKIASIGE